MYLQPTPLWIARGTPGIERPGPDKSGELNHTHSIRQYTDPGNPCKASYGRVIRGVVKIEEEG